MPSQPILEVLSSSQVAPCLDAVAVLRGTVFRDWPYLYEVDDPDYERGYLAAYARSPGSVFVLVRDGKRVVGAATGIPLADNGEALSAPLSPARHPGRAGLLLRRVGAEGNRRPPNSAEGVAGDAAAHGSSAVGWWTMNRILALPPPPVDARSTVLGMPGRSHAQPMAGR